MRAALEAAGSRVRELAAMKKETEEWIKSGGKASTSAPITTGNEPVADR
jgi:hypothetical protein